MQAQRAEAAERCLSQAGAGTGRTGRTPELGKHPGHCRAEKPQGQCLWLRNGWCLCLRFHYIGERVPQVFFPAGEDPSLEAGSSLPGPQLQCAGTTTGALLISLVKITADLQLIVLHVHFCKEGGSGREQQGKPWMNNVALTTHPHQQSTLSPRCSSCRISAAVLHPKFRPASCSSEVLPKAAFLIQVTWRMPGRCG